MKSACLVVVAFALTAAMPFAMAQQDTSAQPSAAQPQQAPVQPSAQQPDAAQPGTTTTTSTTTTTTQTNTDQSQATSAASGASASPLAGTIAKAGDKWVLQTANGTYQLDNQEKASQFEGKQVNVMGSMDQTTSMIHVTDITPAQ